MSVSKKIKIGIWGILGVAFLLFATLIVHIGIMVHKQGELPMATIQMARADFNQAIDSTTALEIQKKIRSMKGVKSTYFNIKDGIVVYTFDNRNNTSQNIYDHAIKNFPVSSVRYTVSEEDLSQGCPVMNNHSFYGKLTTLVSKFVH